MPLAWDKVNTLYNLNQSKKIPLLNDLIDNYYTDKNTVHSYIPVYNSLFSQRYKNVKNVLEVGVWMGGSIKLLNDYFENATIYGIDIMDNVYQEVKHIKESKNIKLYLNNNGYDSDFVHKTFGNIKFDILIDDGPHTLESMKAFIKLYLPLLSNIGILIVEDVKSLEWISELENIVPYYLKRYIKVYDLRNIKNQEDDILFTIDFLL